MGAQVWHLETGINTNNAFSNLEMLPTLPSLNDATARCQCHSTRMDPLSTSLLV